MKNKRLGNFRTDLRRYPKNSLFMQPALWAIAVYRFGRGCRTLPFPARFIGSVTYIVLYSFVRLATGIDIPRSADFGPGLMIHHFGGIIIHPQVKVGANFTMRQGVTIGSRYDRNDVPVIGDSVTVGAHAQILGEIRVGNDAVIGAMSLVIRDVEPGKTVAGIPAREIG